MSPRYFLPRVGSAFWALTLSSVFVGCSSDQPATTDAPPAVAGHTAAGAGPAVSGAGNMTGGTGGNASSGAGAGSVLAGAATGGSGLGGAGPTGESGAPSRAGNAGHGGSVGGTGGSSGSAGTAAAGSAGTAAAGSAGSAGGEQPSVTVWIAGDSTVATGGPCPIGWGGQFKALFNTKVSVTNSAVAGRSVRTWLYDVLDTKDSAGECNLGKDAQGNPTVQARWTSMLTGMKTGDYLFVQFGINDSDSACPRHVGASAFKTSYGLLAQAAKDRGAQPIFVTPVSQIACSGSTVNKATREPFVTATKEAGAQYGVPVIDLNALSTTLYQSLGFCPIPGGSDVSATTTGAVGTFFCDDHTHFDTPGAVKIAALVAQALRDQKSALSAYLK